MELTKAKTGTKIAKIDGTIKGNNGTNNRQRVGLAIAKSGTNSVKLWD